MTKEQVIKGCIKLIEKIAEEKGFEVIDQGTGHGFDNSFWNLTDTSGIPTISAKDDNYSILLRPFWSSPEIDIRKQTELGEDLLVFNFSDFIKNKETNEYEHTGDYSVRAIEVNVRCDHKKAIEEVYQMIDEVERGANE